MVICSNNTRWDFKLANFSSVWREIHTCSINDSIMACISPPNKPRI